MFRHSIQCFLVRPWSLGTPANTHQHAVNKGKTRAILRPTLRSPAALECRLTIRTPDLRLERAIDSLLFYVARYVLEHTVRLNLGLLYLRCCPVLSPGEEFVSKMLAKIPVCSKLSPTL